MHELGPVSLPFSSSFSAFISENALSSCCALKKLHIHLSRASSNDNILVEVPFPVLQSLAQEDGAAAAPGLEWVPESPPSSSPLLAELMAGRL